MPAFTFDEASHEYRLDGVRLPSVTQLIGAAGIGADFSRVQPDVLEAKRALGTAVHLACEIDDEGELDDDSTDPVVMQYVAAWRRFRLDCEVVVMANEERLYHPTLRFAGTIDRLVTMRLPDVPGGRATVLIDLKTGAEPWPHYGVQLAAYLMLLRERGVTGDVQRGTVHLSADGTYRLRRFNNHSDEAAFRACLALHAWKEATK